jgi:hypothetical protein
MMAKLTDVMREIAASRGPRQSVTHEGAPCPFCGGERTVEVYLHVSVRKRQVGHATAAKRGQSLRDGGYFVARPSFWQGACPQCAAAIQDEIAERAGRYDYLRKVNGGETQDPDAG